MKNKLMFIINIAFISGIFVLNYFYQSNNFDFTLKCICSGGFAALGIINFLYMLKSYRRYSPKKRTLLRVLKVPEHF